MWTDFRLLNQLEKFQLKTFQVKKNRQVPISEIWCQRTFQWMDLKNC